MSELNEPGKEYVKDTFGPWKTGDVHIGHLKSAGSNFMVQSKQAEQDLADTLKKQYVDVETEAGAPGKSKVKQMILKLAGQVPTDEQVEKIALLMAAGHNLTTAVHSVINESPLKTFLEGMPEGFWAPTIGWKNQGDGTHSVAVKLRDVVDPLTDMMASLPWTGGDVR